MSSIYEKLLNPLDEGKRKALCDVAATASALGTPFMVFGAFARDVHFFHARNIDITRSTSDMDFSIQVESWSVYNRFSHALNKRGYRPRSPEHQEKRVHQETQQELDLLPFGEIAADGSVTWPSDGSPWSVVGFDEAFEHADTLVLSDDLGQTHRIAVAPIPALVVLKLVAICDRPEIRHKKDGTDIAFILNNYLDVEARKRIASNPPGDLLHGTEGDPDLAVARLLGSDIRKLLKPAASERIQVILRHEIESQSRCFVVRGLIGRYYPTFSRAKEVVSNMLEGMIRLGTHCPGDQRSAEARSPNPRTPVRSSSG